MKKIIYLVAFIGLMLVSCSKSLDDWTLTEYLGTDQQQIKELISKELTFASIDTLDLIISRYKLYNELDKNKDKSILWALQENREYLDKLKPRKEFYDIAVQSLKDGLKFPNAALIPQLTLHNSDSLSIDKDTSMKGEYYEVKIKYYAPNSFGAMLDGDFVSFIKRDSTGKLIEWYHSNR